MEKERTTGPSPASAHCIPIAKRFGNEAVTAMLPIECDYLCQDPDGTIRFGGAVPLAILPGSFNPLHDGHRRLAAAVLEKHQLSVAYEISIRNVDKPELGAEEIRRRLAQFL